MDATKPMARYKRKKKIDLSKATIMIVVTVLVSIIAVMAFRIYDQTMYERKIKAFTQGEFSMYKSHYKNLTFDIFIETKKAAKKERIPIQEVLAFFHNESNFNRYAVSHTGAQGIGQLMPDTAKMLGVKNSFDIKQNIPSSVKFYKYCKKRADGDILLAYKKYNGGPNRVKFTPGGESEIYSGKCYADLRKTTYMIIARL